MRALSIRRQYLVRRRFQGTFIVAFLVLAVLASLATGLIGGHAADRALEAVLFRAHFTEHSTGEIVLPVLLRVNLVGLTATLLCGVLLAHWMFRRAGRHLDRLCARLTRWAEHLAGGDPAPAPPPDLDGWTGDLERSMRAARLGLQARYLAATGAARALLAEVRRLESALHEGDDPTPARHALEGIRERLRALERELVGTW